MKILFLFLLFSHPLFAKTESVDLKDFEGLMGKYTAHWRYVAQSQDRETLAYAQKLYEKNRAAQFNQTGLYKIPPVVHFIWLGPRPFPPESVENIRTWIAQNPEWKVKFWTDRDRELPCEGMEKVFVRDFHFSKLERCYEESENWAEKSDLLRYEILLKEGGVYVDHDANCLRPFDNMHRAYDFFCCLETPHEPFVGRNVTCGNGVIGSRPRHPTVEQVIDLIATRWDELGKKFRGKDEYSRIEIVMQRTYIALTLAMKETMDKEGNIDIVLPAAYFFSKTGISPLYSQHFYATAWDDFKWRKSELERTSEKSLGKIHRKNHHLSLILYGLLGLNLSLLGLIIAKKGKKA